MDMSADDDAKVQAQKLLRSICKECGNPVTTCDGATTGHTFTPVVP